MPSRLHKPIRRLFYRDRDERQSPSKALYRGCGRQRESIERQSVRTNDMKRVWAANWICALASLSVLCGVVSAEEPSCREISAMARTAHAKSSRAVVEEKQKAGDSYRAQVVLAERSFELHPMDKEAAVLLLSLIPPGRRATHCMDDDGRQPIRCGVC